MSSSTTILHTHFSETRIPDNLNKSDIKCIKEWLKKNPHLPELSDFQIAMFLHSCYGALEATKSAIDSYHTIRTQAGELFDNRTPEEISETSNTIYASLLPKPSLEKERLIIIGFSDENPEKFSPLKTIRILFSLMDIESHLHPFASGWRIIINTKGISFGHFMKVIAHLGLLKKAIYYVQDGLPLRLKGIHIFNAMPLVNQIVAVVRPFMKKELYDMIHIHSTNNTESMYKFIPQQCLPSDSGGEGPSIQELIKMSNEKMETYKQWFIDDDEIGRIDESKRVNETQASILGFDGIFKKLGFR